jgi:RimJ/RimL family protein N-acetyltransferase
MIRLQTERLLLRNFVAEDWRALREIIAGYAASAWAAYDHTWPTAPGKVREIVASFARADTTLAVTLRDSGRLIGLVSLPAQPQLGDDVVGLGYVFDFTLHRRGYATEACRALLAHAFHDRAVHRVNTGCADANLPSMRLLQRLGFQQKGSAPHAFGTRPDRTRFEFVGHRFELTAADWFAVTPRTGASDVNRADSSTRPDISRGSG